MVLMNFYAACLPVGVSMYLYVCVCVFRSVICSCCFYWINDARVAADAAGVAELKADFSLSLSLPLSLSLSPADCTIRSTLLLLLFFEFLYPVP